MICPSVAEFLGRWNIEAKTLEGDLGTSLVITTPPPLQTGPVLDAFEIMFGKDIGLAGLVNKGDGSVRSATLIGRTKNAQGTARFLGLWAVLMTVSNRGVTPSQRGAILERLGALSKETSNDHSASTTEGTIRYTLIKNAVMGVWFCAEDVSEPDGPSTSDEQVAKFFLDALSKAKTPKESEEEQRLDAVRDAVRKVGSGAACKSATAISDAWNGLRTSRSSDPKYRAATVAVAKLERCRKKLQASLYFQTRKEMARARQFYAANFEQNMLETLGQDTTVRAAGKYGEILKIRWILGGRAQLHELTHDGDSLKTLREVGFKKVVVTDGFYETWSAVIVADDDNQYLEPTELDALAIGAPLNL